MDFLILNEQEPNSWQRFLAGARHALCNELAARWERVRNLGVNPDGVEKVESIVTAGELRNRRQQLGELLTISTPILESAAPGFSDGDFGLLLADADGVVLRMLGGGEFAPYARQTRLIEGADWSEEVRGTNAIGTALTEARPVVVAGCAHFERTNHDLICYSYPIRSPAGEVVAVLDATSHSRSINPLAKAAIAMTARAIEEAWRHAVLTGLGRSPQTMSNHLASLAEPAFFITPGGAIKGHNRIADDLVEGSPPTIQQTLSLSWSSLRGAIDAGQDKLTLAPSERGDGPQRVELEPIFDGPDLIGMVVVVIEGPAQRVESTSAPSRPPAFAKIVGHDPTLLDSLEVAGRFARSSLPVLILAETGTGKELMAHAIHHASQRRDGPFVTVNCGALTPSLLESELFGYGPGAFTGASPEGRMGRLAAADQGTLFLDEVGEMSPELQTLLLRVLEGGTYTRVGELETRHSDIRLICATCRDLPAMVDGGTFRKDLFYRIRGACLTLPPLRDRRDITDLATHLLTQLCEDLEVPPPGFADSAIEWLTTYTWPGNVRELKNALHHALVLAGESGPLAREHFPHPLLEEAQASAAPTDKADSPGHSIDDAERRALVKAYEATEGNISAIARRLDVARSTVYRMLKRHNLR